VAINSVSADVALSSEFAPYLVPNLYCDYNESSACVARARELAANAENEGDVVHAVFDYITSNVTYDSAKAEELSTTTGYVPNPDETLSSGTGICFDYASLGAAMLRSLGIPAQIKTGYVSPGDIYHAWVMVYIDGRWESAEFSVGPDEWTRMDLTFAAADSSYVGDGTSYDDRFTY
jgi:transglutaminase-like putative cysteine protease